MAINRRLIIWLIRAYVQKWGKAIFAFFILGLFFFFLLQTFVFSFISKITSENRETYGLVGTYSIDSLPLPLLQTVSRGLTTITPDGIAHPDLANTWQIKDSGKTYIFYLKKHLSFTDGTPFTTKQIAVSYANVRIEKLDDYTIAFHLQDSYAPFLVSVSRPLFKNGFVGLGPNVVKNVVLNGSFIQSLTISPAQNTGSTRVYQFYPTDDALKLALVLGEVSVAQNLSDNSFQHMSLNAFPNLQLSKTTDYTTLVTLFYNTTDRTLSDPKLREALSYTIPNTFSQGERAYSPLSPLSWAYQNNNHHTLDYTHAKLLVEASLGTKTSSYPLFTISCLAKYEEIAHIIQASWKKIGLSAKIVVVPTVPPSSSFQIYLGDFHLPQDPDQYTLWHSYQENNITNLNKDVRIDKLLEDGRKIVNQSERVKIYSDFQKYLINDQPATFLYFPYSYTVKRK